MTREKNKDNNNDAASSASSSEEEVVVEEEVSLPKLLSALALGVRAVNSIPLSTSLNKNKNDDDEDDDEEEDMDDEEDDEFAYNMAFPEYASLCNESRFILSKLLSESLDAASSTHQHHHQEEEEEIQYYSYEDPTLWEKCADVCEALLEHVEVYVEDVQEGRVGGADVVVETAADLARQRANGGYQRILSGLVDMEKPQQTYKFQTTIQNSRSTPFKPTPHPQKPYSLTPLSQCLENPIQGHGLETRYGSLMTKKYSEDVVAPSMHYCHPYQTEIEQFEYRDWQLEVNSKEELINGGLGGTLLKENQEEEEKANSISTTEAVWIDTIQDLKTLCHRIETENIKEIALDLEAHSHRSFGGFVCLMQLSLRRNNNNNNSNNENTIETASDFLIDTLPLRSSLNQYLAPIFANPDIVKIMHGADSDIPWLQRDFGLYIVNLFDTGRAARLLKFPSAGLAYLLSKYAGVVADKKHQLSDWRQRPLPDDMKAYATSDTLYLLDMYDQLKLELDSNSNADVSVEAVLDASRKVCLIRYDKEPFHPSGYQSLMKWKKRSKATTSFTAKQENVLKALYDWRDKVARQEDESVQYVCPNSALVRFASARPHNVSTLQGLVNPLPPLVLRYSQDVLDVIKHSSEVETEKGGSNTTTSTAVASSTEKNSQLRASASPFAFRPAGGNGGAAPSPVPLPSDGGRPSTSEPSGILSPVLGTEALYKQAGWMTPQTSGSGGVSAPSSVAINPHMISMDEAEGTSSTDDDCYIDYNSSSNKNERSGTTKNSKRTLSVCNANEHFVSNEYTSHSIELNSFPDDDDDLSSAERAGKSNNADGVNCRGKSVDGLGAAREALRPSSDNSSMGDDQDNSNAAASTVEEECKAARESALKIRKIMSRNDAILLGLVLPQNSGEFGKSLDREGDDDDMDEDDLEENEEDENDEEEDAIPKSIREIYKISNRNRRKPKKNLSSIGNDEENLMEESKMPEHMDVDDIEGANALLAKSGLNGKGYFDGRRTGGGQSTNGGVTGGGGNAKRQRTKQGGGGNDDDNATNAANIALIQEVGWVKDKEGAESLLAQQKADGNSGPNTNPDNADNLQVHNNTSGETQKRMNEGQQSSQSSPPTTSFNYNNVGPIAAYNPKAVPSSNPFFAGAAVTGGALTRGGSTAKKSGGGKKGKGNKTSGSNSSGPTERPGKRDGNQSFVYRTGKKR